MLSGIRILIFFGCFIFGNIYGSANHENISILSFKKHFKVNNIKSKFLKINKFEDKIFILIDDNRLLCYKLNGELVFDHKFNFFFRDFFLENDILYIFSVDAAIYIYDLRLKLLFFSDRFQKKTYLYKIKVIFDDNIYLLNDDFFYVLDKRNMKIIQNLDGRFDNLLKVQEKILCFKQKKCFVEYFVESFILDKNNLTLKPYKIGKILEKYNIAKYKIDNEKVYLFGKYIFLLKENSIELINYINGEKKQHKGCFVSVCYDGESFFVLDRRNTIYNIYIK